MFILHLVYKRWYLLKLVPIGNHAADSFQQSNIFVEFGKINFELLNVINMCPN